MLRFRSLLTLLLILCVVPVLAQNDTDAPEILWDTWGVPHIFSPDYEGIFYAFGWAQAQNHADLVLRLYGESRGRAAEYWGEDFLESDELTRTLSIPQQGAESYARLTDEWRVYVDAFAAGINDYAAANPDAVADEVEIVLPVTAEDVMAHGVRVQRYVFIAADAVDAIEIWESGEVNAPESSAMTGSNGWAIAPSRSASGNAMLVANPHQPWTGLGLWIEAHLVAPDLNTYGAALVGTPVLGIAFNDHLGWTHTVNPHDGWDLYELTLEGEDSYIFDGETQTFTTREEIIKVNNIADARMDEVVLTVRESVHGPVVAERNDDTALALRVVAENASEAAIQWWEMGLATTLEEFEAALRPLRIPMFHVIYADREGNILLLVNEQVPVRDFGDWEFWNNTTPVDDSEPAIIPGDSSLYLWDDIHPYDELPRVLNPESGWLQNANETAYTATIPRPFDPGDFPAYMLPEPFIFPRPQTSMRLLHEDESITFEELIEYKHSTFLELTRPTLPDLIAAARESDSELVQRSAEILADWDRRADADSVGAVLFAAWANAYIEPLGFDAFAEAWDLDDPIFTPSGLADPDGAVVALEEAAQQLESLRLLGGGIDVPWGDVFRLRYLDSDVDLPANGGEDLLGSFRVLNYTSDDDLRFRPTLGDSYIALVEFSDPVRAKVLLAYGNSTQPDSLHYGDQLELFAEQELRDAWLTREDIEANLRDRIRFED